MVLKEEVQKIVDGEVYDSPDILEEYSEDKSIFKVTPELVVFPESSEDIKNLVTFAKSKKNISLTARSAGTDMSGGPLSNSIVLGFTKFFNHTREVGKDFAVVEPGVYFRDFEKEILKRGLMFPSYPASKELCALGGIVANNSGGEKSLQYGKTENYVLGLKVVLSDGNEYYIEKLSGPELAKKLNKKGFESDLYNKVYKLIKTNFNVALKAKPDVLKNSSGYDIWNIYNPEDGSFDLTKLFVGSQGTLGIITEIKVKLVPVNRFSKLCVIFVKDISKVPQFVNEVLKLSPGSLEVTDDHTFKLYLKYFREMASLLGAKGIFSTIKLFLPEFIMVLRGGVPKLVILAEFDGNNASNVLNQAGKVIPIAKKYGFDSKIAKNEIEAEKYWRLRRDTYRLLREKLKNEVAAPFIDDLIVKPEYLPEFLPKLYEILDKYKLTYTISGHIGEGNFHVIPLMNFRNDEEKIIHEVTDKVYALVLKYKGSLSAEHNDGLIRSPYLGKQFGKEVFGIFKEIKNIFDPQGIFNPHKKTLSDKKYSLAHIMD